MMRRGRIARGALAGIVGVAIVSLLTGCLGLGQLATRGPDPAPVTEGVPDDLLRFYDQPPQWESCGEGFECTTITAPLDWHDPDRGEIELAVTRHLAERTTPVGALLANPGGPGGSGVSLVRDSLAYSFGQPRREAYDIVGFDPRGVGESTAVRCYDAAQMDAYLYDIPAAERGTPEWESELQGRAADYAHACEANSGGILEFITTEQSARDLDLLRAVLGQEELTYLGYSYGTFLGATYADLFPERAGRLVLDGAIDPSVSGEEVGTTQAVGFEGSLRSFFEWCLGTQGCPFTGSVDNAMSDLSALLAAVDARPIRAEDGRMLGADTLMTAVIAALYAEDNWSYLVAALAGALEGDATDAFFLADFYNGRNPDGTYADNSTDAFNAYNCMDYPATTAAEQAATEQKVRELAPTIAPYWSGADVCAEWPYPPSGERRQLTAEGAAPIVVIGTTGDPATPYEWAVSLADQLSSGVLVTHEGEGHTAYNGGSRCVNSAVEDFLLEGTVPEDGLTCR
nr:alpha/beta hydrolase [Microbacterium sediminis]